MFRKGFVFFIIFTLGGLSSIAQTDSSFNRPPTKSAPQYRRPVFRDSAFLARWQAEKDSIRRVKDSLKAVGDSLSMVWLKRPDPNRPNQFLDSLIEIYSIKDLNFQAWSKRFPKKSRPLRQR